MIYKDFTNKDPLLNSELPTTSHTLQLKGQFELTGFMLKLSLIAVRNDEINSTSL